MATKKKGSKKKASKPARQKSTTILDLNCAFGGVSFGKKTVRVGVTVSRDDMTLGVADNNLCDRRLMLTVHANGADDQPGQGRLEGMEDDLDITSSADVKGFQVHTETIAFGLTFNKNELKKISQKTAVSLDDFAGRAGRIMIAEVDDIPEEEKKADPDEEPAEDGDDAEAEEGDKADGE